MQKRRLGQTGLEVSVLGFGGFHLVEITSAEAARLLGAYLDRGGSYRGGGRQLSRDARNRPGYRFPIPPDDGR